jgi:SAM-dependent methyltransferase
MSKLIQRQEFNPKIIGLFTNPFYVMRRELRRSIALYAPLLSGKLLDIGCGRKPYKELFFNTKEYIGLEFDSERQRNSSLADVFYDGKKLPFTDSSFDSILATEVLEHVFNPEEFLAEASRVLRKGGFLLLTCPFVWDEHEQPHDYARYSSFGLKHLVERSGLEVIQQRKTGSAISALFQLFAAYLNKLFLFKSYRLKLLCRIIFISPVQILGIFFSSILPRNKDLYLGNVILAKKK